VHNVRVPRHVARHVVRPPAVAPPWSAWIEFSARNARPCEVVVKENFVAWLPRSNGRRFRRRTSLRYMDSGAGLPSQHGLLRLPTQSETHARHLVGQSKTSNKGSPEAATVVKPRTTSVSNAWSWAALARSPTCISDKATSGRPRRVYWHQRGTSAMILGLKPEDVPHHLRRGSGCYGINGADTVTFDDPRCCRKPWASPSACSSPKRRNGVGELRLRFRYGRAPGSDAQGNIIAVGSRSVVTVLGNRPGYALLEIHHRIAGGLSA